VTLSGQVNWQVSQKIEMSFSSKVHLSILAVNKLVRSWCNFLTN